MALPLPVDDEDPINILLKPFDPIPRAAAAAIGAAVDANAQQLADADAKASQAALDAAGAAAAATTAAEAERERRLAEEKANILRQQTVGGKNINTIFGGAEGEVLYESNVRPSARRWESSNPVETRRSVVDFKMAEPLPPDQLVPDNAPSVLSPSVGGTTSPTTVAAFSQPIMVEVVAAVQAAPAAAAPSPSKAAVATGPPPRAAAAPSPKPVSRQAAPLEGAPSVFSPTAGVHPTTSNKTEEFMKKVGGNTKVRQCPSFRMLEFQIQYDEYKTSKTPVS